MMAQFVSIPLHGSNVKSEKNVILKNISYCVWCLLQCKLYKKDLLLGRELTSDFHFTSVNDYQVRFLVKIYLFKLNNRNTKKTCETMSKVNNKNTRTTSKTSELIPYFFLMSLLLTLSKLMLAELKLFGRNKATGKQH